jgi:xylulokinase
MSYVLGVDIGASSCKAIVFDAGRNAKGRAQEEHPRSYPNPGWVELDANSWWTAVATAIRKSVENSSVPVDQIRCVGISAETDGVLAVGKDGEPLRPYIHWLDTRCVDEHRRLRDQGKVEYVYEKAGIPVQGGYDFPALKMQWIKKNEPAVYERTERFLSIGTFMLTKLTGKYIADRSTASRSLLYDIRKQEWSTDLAELFGIPVSKQPEVRRSAEPVGTIMSQAARETGLSAKTVVVAGGGDTECSALGAGVVSENQALISIGTSLMVAVPIAKPLTIPMGPETRLFGTGSVCTSHVVDNMWILEVGAPVGGAMLAWFDRELGQAERKLAAELDVPSYDILNLEAEKSRPGPESPIFAAPVGAILNLRDEHKRSDLIRSILEGVAFEAREVIEVFEKFGLHIRKLTMVGGGAKSGTWRQIMSDVTNKAVTSPYMQETGTLGAATLAGVGASLFKDFKAPQIGRYADSSPRDNLKETYSILYWKYRRLYKALE